jgi:hypothetical protein
MADAMQPTWVQLATFKFCSKVGSMYVPVVSTTAAI